MKNATTPDPNTLVVHYTAPVGERAAQLQQLAILPKHVWAAARRATRARTSRRFPNTPADRLRRPVHADEVQEGPDRAVQAQPELLRAEAAHRRVRPAVLLERRRDDLGAEVARARRGRGRAADRDRRPSRRPASPSTQVPGVTENDFIINSNPKKTNHRELLNPKVRQAIDARDRPRPDRHTSLARHGQPRPRSSRPRPARWHNPAVKPETFDLGARQPDARLARLQEGLRRHPRRRRPPDVVPGDRPERPHGRRPHLPDHPDRLPEDRDRDLTSARSTRAQPSTRSPRRTKYLNFDLSMWDWVPLIDPDFMLSVVTCAQYGGWSDSGYCDKAYDKMYQQQGEHARPGQAPRDRLRDAGEARARPAVHLPEHARAGSARARRSGPAWVQSPQGPFNSLSRRASRAVHQVG